MFSTIERNWCNLLWLSLSSGIICLDVVTKQLAIKYLLLNQPYPICSFFNLTLAHNTGAAFSFLGDAGGWQQWLFGTLAVLVSLSILVFLVRLPRTEQWSLVALSLILGGALGNLWSRITFGYVIDFIQWYVKDWYFPTFNLADSAIVIGSIMLSLEMFAKRA